MSQDALAVAPTQCIEKAAAAVGGHDDQIDVGLASSFEDHFDDVALFRHLVPRPSGDFGRDNSRQRSVLPHMEQDEFSAFTF